MPAARPIHHLPAHARGARLHGQPRASVGIRTWLALVGVAWAIACSAAVGAGSAEAATGIVREVSPGSPLPTVTYRSTTPPEPGAPQSVSASPARVEVTQLIPGHSYEATIAVKNRRRTRATYRIDRLGALPGNGSGASVDFLAAGDKRMGTTARNWLALPVRSVTLTPGQVARIPVRIVVPFSASPGGHFAAVSISMASSGKLGASGSVGVRARIAVLFLGSVGGQPRYGLKLRSMDVDHLRFGASSIRVTADTKVTGTVHDRPRGRVVVRNLFGNAIATLPIQGTLALPGGTSHASMTWTKPPFFGVYELRLVMYPERSGSPRVVDTQRILILPPWWVCLAIALLVITTITWLAHNRRHSGSDLIVDDDEF